MNKYPTRIHASILQNHLAHWIFLVWNLQSTIKRNLFERQYSRQQQQYHHNAGGLVATPCQQFLLVVLAKKRPHVVHPDVSPRMSAFSIFHRNPKSFQNAEADVLKTLMFWNLIDLDLRISPIICPWCWNTYQHLPYKIHPHTWRYMEHMGKDL